MNLFNRALIVLFTLLFMAVAFTICLNLFHVISFETGGFSLLGNDGIDLRTRLIIAGGCLGILLGGAALIFVELRPLILAEPKYVLAEDDLGRLEISRSCVGKLINYEANHFTGVLNAKSQIDSKKEGFRIISDITVDPRTNVESLGRELQSHFKAEIRDKLGLNVSNVVIKTHFLEKEVSSARRKLA